MKRLVFATNNNHKLEEARAILGGDVELVSLAELGCHDDIPETAPTLEGNALQKAHYIHDRYGVACIADDTGLMVDALDGAPGVYSARYAGPGHDSKANMAKLLRELEGVEEREAHFSTILAYVDEGGEARTFEGRVEGSIAREPSGNDGFGYDPVFIARETGRTFADMSAEEKNAISHRGRAFRTFAAWFTALVAALLIIVAPAQAEQWRMHPSYDGNTYSISDTPKYTYFLTLKQDYRPGNQYGAQRYGQLYRYDKDSDEWQWLGRDTGLSDHIVVAADYDYKDKLLAIGYDNGNIDLLWDNGKLVNVPGLKMASDITSTDIRAITVDPAGGDVWVATATGYVRIDPRKGEVVTSRDYRRAVNGVAYYDGKVYVGTDDGLLYGDERGTDLSRFDKVPDIGRVQRLFTIDGNGLWFTTGTLGSERLKVLRGSAVTHISRGFETTVQPGRGGVLAAGDAGVRWYDAEGNVTDMGRAPGITTLRCGSMDGKTIWFADGRKGMTRMVPRGGKWTVTMEGHKPNASTAFMCVEMAYSPEYGMLVRNHGAEQDFPNVGLPTPDLISGLKNGEWTPYGITYRLDDPQKVYETIDPQGVAVDPTDGTKVYSGSQRYGMMRLDLEDARQSLHLSRPNEAGAGRDGFVTVAPIDKGWDESCSISAPRFDDKGTLWTAYHNIGDNQSEIWYWPTADRTATTNAATYRPIGKREVRGMATSTNHIVLPLATSGTRNMVVFHGGHYSNNFLVWDTAGTPGDTSDDREVIVNRTVDQDGSEFNAGKPTMMWQDRSTGRVWVANSQGVYHFSPNEALSGKTSVFRPKVRRNDGTNQADFLLDGIYVTRITADPGGRKWFGTQGGGIAVTSADGRTVIKTYTAENSELPDNTVYGMEYNHDNNSMMISTGKGLCELFLTGADTGEDAGIRAYPNPVRPEYLGNVVVDGLPQGATVKITDMYNGAVKDLGLSSGGEIEWNLTNNNNKRVPSGIYYVHATNGEEQDKYSKVTKILVVN